MVDASNLSWVKDYMQKNTYLFMFKIIVKTQPCHNLDILPFPNYDVHDLFDLKIPALYFSVLKTSA